MKSLSRVWLLATPWTTAYRAPHPWDFPGRVLEWGAIAFSMSQPSVTIFLVELPCPPFCLWKSVLLCFSFLSARFMNHWIRSIRFVKFAQLNFLLNTLKEDIAKEPLSGSQGLHIASYIYRACNGNPLQYSCLGNPMDRGAWWATVLGVTKSHDWATQPQQAPEIAQEEFERARGNLILEAGREHELPQWFFMACSFEKAFVFPTVQCIYDICFSLGFLNWTELI